MMLRQKQTLAPKIKLNQTLRSWLPILQSGLDELKETLEPFIKDNPFATIEHKNLEKSEKRRNFFEQVSRNSVSESIEALSVYKESLYEKLISQINPPLFPTQKSQDIAYKIIECLDDEGYFSYDDEIFTGFNEGEVERVRARFAHLEPCGVGAKDVKESFLFQLDEAEVSDEIIECARKIILNFENIEKLRKLKFYDDALKIIKKFKNPPAIEYLEDEKEAVPDIFVLSTSSGISVQINDEYYPEILVDTEGLDEKEAFVSSRIKEASELIDALEMRKATLYKIGLMIVE